MSTAADTDLVDALSRMRQQMDLFASAVLTGTVTRADAERMARLFEDFAGVIRVTVGTRQIRDALPDGNGRT